MGPGAPAQTGRRVAGLREKCVDSLVFETLIPKPMMQHYIGLLLKHRRLVLSGPSGTGKTYLTNRLAEYLVERSGREVTEGIVTFNFFQKNIFILNQLVFEIASKYCISDSFVAMMATPFLLRDSCLDINGHLS